MPGPITNGWNRFLNGGSPAFNFTYNSESPSSPLPSSDSHQPLPNIPEFVNKNKNKLPLQQGGKRKSRRSRTKKHRRTQRK